MDSTRGRWQSQIPPDAELLDQGDDVDIRDDDRDGHPAPGSFAAARARRSQQDARAGLEACWAALAAAQRADRVRV